MAIYEGLIKTLSAEFRGSNHGYGGANGAIVPVVGPARGGSQGERMSGRIVQLNGSKEEKIKNDGKIRVSFLFLLEM